MLAAVQLQIAEGEELLAYEKELLAKYHRRAANAAGSNSIGAAAASTSSAVSAVATSLATASISSTSGTSNA